MLAVMSAQTYKSNRHIFYSCKYHVVFCPKYRRKLLVNGIEIRLKEIIQQVADDLECEIIELEVMPPPLGGWGVVTTSQSQPLSHLRTSGKVKNSPFH
jgi:putative transposase